MNTLFKLTISLILLINMGVANASFAERLDGVWEGSGQQTSGFQWTIRFTDLRVV
jgi:hypothetical protein